MRSEKAEPMLGKGQGKQEDKKTLEDGDVFPHSTLLPPSVSHQGCAVCKFLML